MCAQRNPQAKPNLIGKSASCDKTIPTWRGNYPVGLSPDEFAKAQNIRRAKWEGGARQAEIVEAFENEFGPTNYFRGAATEAQPKGIEASIIKHLPELMVAQWSTIWDGKLTPPTRNLVLGNLGVADFAAFEYQAKRDWVVELQSARETAEVVETVCEYRNAMACGISVCRDKKAMPPLGAIISLRVTPELKALATPLGIHVYQADVKVTAHAGSQSVQVRVKRA